MAYLEHFLHSLTPVSNPSDNLRKRIQLTLNGAETNAEGCFRNPFALEDSSVTDVDGKDYDIREVLHYFNTGRGYSSENQEPIYLVPCPDDGKCVNPHHVTTFRLSPVSSNRFFKSHNQEILNQIPVYFNRPDLCWIYRRKNQGEQGFARQLTAIAFGVFDTSKVRHLAREDVQYGLMRKRKGEPYWSTCSPYCVNPHHAPSSPAQQGNCKFVPGTPEHKAYLKFKAYVNRELLAGRGSIICPSRKITYSTEEKAALARAKWLELKLDKHNPSRIYRCDLCAFWHMSSKKLKRKWKSKKKAARPLVEGELFALK